MSAHGIHPTDDALLEAFAHEEARAQRAAWTPYAHVLERVVDGIGDRFGFRPLAGERSALASSLTAWLAFPDTAAALAELQRRYRLVVVSNIDDDQFAGTARGLGVELHDVVTAQQVRSYKPGRRHFDEVCARTGLHPSRILHVAQSLHHDIAPAKALGFATVRVNRRTGRTRSGATPPSDAVPDLEVPDLATLAARVAEAWKGEPA